jgi:hypothetical protein
MRTRRKITKKAYAGLGLEFERKLRVQTVPNGRGLELEARIKRPFLWKQFVRVVLGWMLVNGANGMEGDFQGVYHMESFAFQSVTVTLTEKRFDPAENVTGYLAYAMVAPHLPNQPDVTSILAVNGNPGLAKTINDLSPLSRPMFMADISPQPTQGVRGAIVSVTYQGTWYKRKLVKGATPYGPPVLTTTQRLMLLRPTSTLNFQDASFQAWIDGHDLRRKPEETQLRFGFRAYSFLRANVKYGENGKSVLSRFCDDYRGNCGHFSMLFAGIMRANQIPALIMAGFWIGSGASFQKGFPPHVKAAFFADGIGWIPVDASMAVYWKTDGFGIDGGDFLATHIDPDIRFPSRYWGDISLQWMQGVYLPAAGGTWQGARISDTLDVKSRKIADVQR